MSLHRQISNLDEVSESVDEMSFSPTFSDEPDFIDELICELALVDDEVTSRPTSTSKVISSYEDVDAVISSVCRSFLFPDGMESEDSGEEADEDEDLTLQFSKEAELLIAKVLDNAVKTLQSTKAAEVLVSQVLDNAIKTLQSTKAAEVLVSQVLDNAVKTLQSTKEVRPPDSTEEVKTPVTPQPTPDPGVTQPELVDHTKKEETLEGGHETKKRFSVWRSRKIQPAPLDPSKEAESKDDLGAELMSTQLEEDPLPTASLAKQTKKKKVNRLSRFFHDLYSKAKRRFYGNSVRPL